MCCVAACPGVLWRLWASWCRRHSKKSLVSRDAFLPPSACLVFRQTVQSPVRSLSWFSLSVLFCVSPLLVDTLFYTHTHKLKRTCLQCMCMGRAVSFPGIYCFEFNTPKVNCFGLEGNKLCSDDKAVWFTFLVSFFIFYFFSRVVDPLVYYYYYYFQALFFFSFQITMRSAICVC